MSVQLTPKWLVRYGDIVDSKKYLAGCFDDHQVSEVPVTIETDDTQIVGHIGLEYMPRGVMRALTFSDVQMWADKVDDDGFEVGWKPGISVLETEWRGIEEPIECVIHAVIYELTLMPKRLAVQQAPNIRLLEAGA